MLENRSKALIGSWIQAIGTTISAVGNTHSKFAGDVKTLTNQRLSHLQVILAGILAELIFLLLDYH
ncbi:hypothetical protein [Bacillus sp. SD088]|uniref:hypothetical protein n=1 Tax=Bacillus sp. SD088 TaxID=2782012 RepID=UPI001A9591A6|nr:hypothetical protein [Bacillus sp. SD088]MBO0994612.1 hypothetical protein [Bacillus sp. SD088]